MTTFSDRIPTYRKFFRFLWKSFLGLFTWRRMRRLLLASATVITLLAIFYAVEDWRGQRDWEAYKAKQKQAGLPFTTEDLQPPPVPDDQNFAMTPSLAMNRQQGKNTIYGKVGRDVLSLMVNYDGGLLARLGTGQLIDLNELAKPWTGAELVDAMKQYDPVLDEFTAASRRPAARFPENFSLLGVFDLTRVFQLRAVMELANGQTDRAADDVVTMFRIGRHLTQGDTLTVQLISCADSLGGAAVLQYGLAQHLWADEQLSEMQAVLEQIDYVAALERGFQEEQVKFNEVNLGGMRGGDGLAKPFLNMYAHSKSPALINLLWALLPSGWVDENLINYNQYFSGLVSVMNVTTHQFDVEKLKSLDFDRKYTHARPYTFLANIAEINFFGIMQGGAIDIERLDLVKVACALERYRLANGKLPEKLDELTPQFMAKIPTNVMTGGPLHYQRLEDGHYLLFAAGWDTKEDGRQVPGITDIVIHDGAPK
jgi:hypothetical protein